MAPRMRRRITSAKREEIEKQQKALSQTIVRPFEVLSGLPLSYNPPPNGHYEDVLKNPLTTKDSGVLYRSLMKSRLNYMNIGPMFKLYWLKQSSYAKKMQQLEQEKHTTKAQKEEKSTDRVPILGNDVSARDVMVKLCDASLSLGPHKFEIRLFIAKDERSEKGNKKKDEEKMKKEPNEANGSKNENENENEIEKTNMNNSEHDKPTTDKESLWAADKPNNEIGKVSTKLDVAESAREPSIKPKDSSDATETSLFKHETEDRPERSLKTVTNSLQYSSNKTETISNRSTESTMTQTSDSLESLTGKETHSANETVLENNKAETSGSKQEECGSIKKSAEKTSDELDICDKQKTNISNVSEYIENKSEKETNSKEQADNEDRNRSNNSNSDTDELAKPPFIDNSSSQRQYSNPNTLSQNSTPIPPTVSNPKSDPNYMQSIENTIMIANLNTIARVDQSLNALMKIVALGNASPQQIITFQGYIQRAREMGPQPHHAYLFPNGILPNQRLRKMSKDKKPVKEKKQPKSKVPKDQKLTAFQEKYLTDATLLFEFVENANVRYMLPQEAICEVIPPANDENEDPDNKDILVSFLWIHNQNEVDDYNKKLNEYEEFKRKEEEGELNKKKLKEEEELKFKQQNEKPEQPEEQKTDIDQKAHNDQKSDNVDEAKEVKQEEEGNKVDAEITRPTRRPPARKGRKRKGAPPPNRKAITQKPECPTEPEIKYTALSFTIHGIPSRYIPIITNSFKKLEDVQERMSYILKHGIRTANFYLWYQVDGKLDEPIAEEIRVQLNQEEKKIQGVTSTQAATSASAVGKKRKQKEKGSEPKPKKNKAETTAAHDENQNLENKVSDVLGDSADRKQYINEPNDTKSLAT